MGKQYLWQVILFVSLVLVFLLILVVVLWGLGFFFAMITLNKPLLLMSLSVMQVCQSYEILLWKNRNLTGELVTCLV